MKKVYMFYLYGDKDEINSDNYFGIDGLDIIKGNKFYHVFYAWTTNKTKRKIFKQQRDMDKFMEVIHEIPKEDFDKFSDENSDTFLEERAITTKDINEFNKITKQTVYILSTGNELNNIVDNELYIARKELECTLLSDIYLRAEYFSEKYKNVLEFFNFDEIMSYAYPLDDNDFPFKMFTDDMLAVYTHFYHNTYRKDILK